MKFAKKSLGYALTFAAGTILSGSVVFAATTYVQAQKVSTSVTYHGDTISHPAGLVYGDSMYVQLYSINQALKQAGFVPGWDGSTLSLSDNHVAKLTSGTSDNTQAFVDIGYSYTSVLSNVMDFIKAAETPNATPQSMLKADNLILENINDNITALQKDTPTDAALSKVQTEYVASLGEFVKGYNDFDQYLQNSDLAALTSFKTDYAKAAADFQQAYVDFNSYASKISTSAAKSTQPFAKVVASSLNRK